MKDIIKKFRKEYKKAYKGILPDEVLEKGNEWFETFITKALTDQKQEIIDKIEKLRIDEEDLSGKKIEYLADKFGVPVSIMAIRLLDIKKEDIIKEIK